MITSQLVDNVLDECLELSQQGVNWMVRRNMQQASRINERTERKIKTCVKSVKLN